MFNLFKKFTFHARLFLFLFFSCVIMLGFSSSVESSNNKYMLAQSKSINWKKNDIIASFIVCLSEETILEVARQDTISLNNTTAFVRAMINEGRCISFAKPLNFKVDEVILEYIDSLDNLSLILRINHLHSDSNPFGFLIAEQKPST